jgi:hypothetical protein
MFLYTGVQSINDIFHIVDKIDYFYTHNFNLIDNVEYVVYALYSRIVIKSNLILHNLYRFKNYLFVNLKVKLFQQLILPHFL